MSNLVPAFRDCERARRNISPDITLTDGQSDEWQIGRDVLTQMFRLHWKSTVTVDQNDDDATAHMDNSLILAGEVELAYSAGGKKKSLRIYDAYHMTAHRRKYLPTLDSLTSAEVQVDGTVYAEGYIDLDLATMGLLPEFPGLCVPRQQDFLTIRVTAGDADNVLASNSGDITSITQSITYHLERYELRARQWNAQGYGSFNEFSGRFPALSTGWNNRLTLPVGYNHRSLYLFAWSGTTDQYKVLVDTIVDAVRIKLNGSDYRFDLTDQQIISGMIDTGNPLNTRTGVYVIEFPEIDQLPPAWGAAIDASNSSMMEVEVNVGALPSTVNYLNYCYSYLELAPA